MWVATRDSNARSSWQPATGVAKARDSHLWTVIDTWGRWLHFLFTNACRTKKIYIGGIIMDSGLFLRCYWITTSNFNKGRGVRIHLNGLCWRLVADASHRKLAVAVVACGGHWRQPRTASPFKMYENYRKYAVVVAHVPFCSDVLWDHQIPTFP